MRRVNLNEFRISLKGAKNIVRKDGHVSWIKEYHYIVGLIV